MSESLPDGAAPAYRDRRTGLVGFGILVIVLGSAQALFVPMILAGSAAAARMRGGEPDLRTMLGPALLHAGSAALFVSLGIGSIRTRRWARTLILIVAWAWLLGGVLTLPALGFLLPRALATMPESAGMSSAAVRAVVTVLTLGFVTVFFVVLPGVLVLFYRSRHVKATCEARNPKPSWTDACAPQVLGYSLFFGLTALSTLPTILAYRGLTPFCGFLLAGSGGVLLQFMLLSLWGYCAWGTYRRSRLAFRVSVVAFVLFSLSAAATFARVGFDDVYRSMGYPESQIEEMQKLVGLSAGAIASIGSVFTIAFVAYAFSVRKHFRPIP